MMYRNEHTYCFSVRDSDSSLEAAEDDTEPDRKPDETDRKPDINNNTSFTKAAGQRFTQERNNSPYSAQMPLGILPYQFEPRVKKSKVEDPKEPQDKNRASESYLEESFRKDNSLPKPSFQSGAQKGKTNDTTSQSMSTRILPYQFEPTVKKPKEEESKDGESCKEKDIALMDHDYIHHPMDID